MRRGVIYIMLMLSSIMLEAQVRPDQFPLESSPTSANFEVYSQKDGVSRRATLDDLKLYLAPFANLTPIAFIPSTSGNVTNLAEMVEDPEGSIWYIDGQGRAIRMGSGSGITIDSTLWTLIGSGIQYTNGRVVIGEDVSSAILQLKAKKSLTHVAEIINPDSTGDGLVLRSSNEILTLTDTTGDLRFRFFEDGRLQHFSYQNGVTDSMSAPVGYAAYDSAGVLRSYALSNMPSKQMRYQQGNALVTQFGSDSIAYSKVDNIVTITVPLGVSLTSLRINEETANMSGASEFVLRIDDQNGDVNNDLASFFPPTLDFIKRDNGNQDPPTSSNPYIYTVDSAPTSQAQITDYGSGILEIRWKNIDSFGKWTAIATW